MYSNGQKNLLDLARLFFATSVLLLHVHHLVPIANENHFLKVLSDVGSYGVPAFFAVSGFLIFMSYDKAKSNLSFFCARFFRIYPAYLFVVVSTAVIALLISSSNFSEFCEYLFWNLGFMNFMAPQFGGLFDDNLLSAFNGSLWTLKVEVMFYCTVPLIMLIIKKFGLSSIILIYLLGKASQFLAPILSEYSGVPAQTISNQFPSQLPYFIAGLVLYRYYHLIFKFPQISVSLSLIIFFTELWVLYEFAFTLLIVWLFVELPKGGYKLPFGDISYGVYITHFPVIQFMVLFGFDEKFGLLGFVVLVFSIVFVFSYFLSKFIEMPSIRYARIINRSEK